MVGRLTEQKDPHTFVGRGEASASKSHPEAVFLVVGDGDLAESTAARIDDASGESGCWDGARTRTISSQRPTSTCSAPAGRASRSRSLAAQYLGKPIVATDKLGLPEVVVHERTGLLACEGSPASYADAVNRLIEDAELRRSTGRHGRELVERRHSLEAMVGRFEALFAGDSRARLDTTDPDSDATPTASVERAS